MTGLSDTAHAETAGHQQPSHSEGGDVPTKALYAHFTDSLELPPEAVQWLLDVWACFQLFDDVADEDPISRADLDKVLWASMISMHTNAFFDAKKHALLPVLATQILKWQASDAVERAGGADARSYVWRAGYYDLVLMVLHLCHGLEVATRLAPFVMNLYGETLDEYLKEFEQCQHH